MPSPPQGTGSGTSPNQLQEILSEYHKEIREQGVKRRRENVHVLVALGVIGGYITFATSRSQFFSPGLEQLVAQVLVAISGVYLIAKMTTITLRPEFDNRWIDLLDERIEPVLYMISIYGLLIIGTVNILHSHIQNVPGEFVYVSQGVLFVVLFISIILWFGKAATNNIAKTEERLLSNITKTLALLRNEGHISESKSNEINIRFNNVLRGRDDIGILDWSGILVNEENIFRLNREDRRALSTILERIKIKIANNQPVNEDVDAILERLENIEER